MNPRLTEELNMFKALKEHFKSHPDYRELDEFGFSLTPAQAKTDILYTALTHGDEVIGIQILNMVLQSLKEGIKLNYNVAFLLNNLEAYYRNIRFIETDLNRSFCFETANTLEKKRASQIEKIVTKLKPSYLIDLHQTIEFSTGAFAVLPETPELIRLAHKIAPNYQIVSFSDKGFSQKGKTLIEFAKTLSIPALVFELESKGFNEPRAREFTQIILNLQPKTLGSGAEKVPYYLITGQVPNESGLRLLPEIQSLKSFTKGQIIAKSENRIFVAPEDCVIIFPRYQNREADDVEIGLLAVKKELK